MTDEQAARAVLGGPVNRLGAGVGSVAYTDGARVVRLGTAGASRYVVDAAIRTALRAAGVPTPEPLGQGTLPGGRPYSVDALAAGDETPPAPDGWRDLGRALGVLHALPCRGFGLLNVDETGLVGAAITPPDGLRTRLPDVWPHGKTALEAQPHLLAAPDLAPLLRPLEQALRGVIALPAAPLHTDLHAGQLRWQGGRLAALLDFGDAAAGPSAWDAASLAYFHGWDVAEVAGLQPGPDAFLFGLLLAQHRARRAGDEVKLARAVAFARTCLDRLN